MSKLKWQFTPSKMDMIADCPYNPENYYSICTIFHNGNKNNRFWSVYFRQDCIGDHFNLLSALHHAEDHYHELNKLSDIKVEIVR